MILYLFGMFIDILLIKFQVIFFVLDVEFFIDLGHVCLDLLNYGRGTFVVFFYLFSLNLYHMDLDVVGEVVKNNITHFIHAEFWISNF